MRRLVVIPIVAFVLGGASPAWAIHDPVVPAGACAAENSEAVGHPAATPLKEKAKQPVPNPGRSGVALKNNKAKPPCANAA